jgi:general secretion pathway protein H
MQVTRRRHLKQHQRGLTLLEVLVVVALIALLGGMAMFGTGMLSSSRLRTSAVLVVSAVRQAQARANAIGRSTRLIFDLDQQRIELEEAVSRGQVRVESEPSVEEQARELSDSVRSEAERVVEGASPPPARYRPAARFAADMGADDAGNGRELGRGVRFRQVHVGRDDEPALQGRVALYFWPGGQTEHASVQLERDERDSGLTVLISALTGRARIERGRVELSMVRLDSDGSERQEQ